MKSPYIDHQSWAIVDVSEIGDLLYEVNRINVPRRWRGRGIARKLVTKVLEDADREKITLVLDINPYGDMDYKALKAWYERLGFSQEKDQRFYRKPQ